MEQGTMMVPLFLEAIRHAVVEQDLRMLSACTHKPSSTESTLSNLQ